MRRRDFVKTFGAIAVVPSVDAADIPSRWNAERIAQWSCGSFLPSGWYSSFVVVPATKSSPLVMAYPRTQQCAACLWLHEGRTCGLGGTP
jgi:hypothetical protein